jgi:hypothetical protein
VVIGAGTHVHHATVLPGTYVPAKLDIAERVVGKDALYSQRWQSRLAFHADDGLMAPLHCSTQRAGSGWLGRFLAALLVGSLAPLGLLHALLHTLNLAPAAWLRRPVVVGRDAITGHWYLRSVRVLRSGHGRFWAWILNPLGKALDIVGGNRRWVGPRPRSVHELTLLPRDWQLLLGSRLPGWWHAPVLHEPMTPLERHEKPGADRVLAEAMAAADVFAVVTQSRFYFLRIAMQHLRLAWS